MYDKTYIDERSNFLGSTMIIKTEDALHFARTAIERVLAEKYGALHLMALGRGFLTRFTPMLC